MAAPRYGYVTDEEETGLFNYSNTEKFPRPFYPQSPTDDEFIEYREIPTGSWDLEEVYPQPKAPSPSFCVGIQKNLKHMKETVSPFHDARTKEIFIGEDGFAPSLNNLRKIDNTEEIVNLVEYLLLDIVELEREERLLNYGDPLSTKLKDKLKETIKTFFAYVNFSGRQIDEEKLKATYNTQLKELNELASKLTTRTEIPKLWRRILNGFKTLAWSMFSWASRFAAAGAVAGTAAGATIGAVGGTLVVPVLGTAAGGAAGAGLGAAAGAAVGGFGGAICGFFYGGYKALKGQDSITQDRTIDVINEMRNYF
ncbi:MAG TPA: hypothetical protein VHM20_05085 [Gammaproteobacteria bacterium]|jgi:hypothetical protein|nr:hypothetical protein [Gammaproteobacteria bacterium]